MRISHLIRESFCLLAFLTVALLVNAQISMQAPSTAVASSKTFDVVSVRPSDPHISGYSIRPTQNGLTITGGSLKFLIQFAYDVHDFQIEDAPEWTIQARFDIIAKMDSSSSEKLPGPSTLEDRDSRQALMQVRLQAILADRFKLRVRQSTKEMPVYALVVAKGGPKFKASTKNTGYTAGPGQFICSATSMEALASMLSGAGDRIVLDQTKLMGDYAFTLKWDIESGPGGDASLPGLFTAVQEQLGLKLVPTKGLVDVLFVEHIEMPSPN